MVYVGFFYKISTLSLSRSISLCKSAHLWEDKPYKVTSSPKLLVYYTLNVSFLYTITKSNKLTSFLIIKFHSFSPVNNPLVIPTQNRHPFMEKPFLTFVFLVLARLKYLLLHNKFLNTPSQNAPSLTTLYSPYCLHLFHKLIGYRVRIYTSMPTRTFD